MHLVKSQVIDSSVGLRLTSTLALQGAEYAARFLQKNTNFPRYTATGFVQYCVKERIFVKLSAYENDRSFATFGSKL